MFIRQSPAAQMGGLVLFLLKKKKTRELCGLCFREAMVCNWETSHWPMGGNVTTYFPTLLGVSSNAFLPHDGGGVVHRHRCACLLCKKGFLAGR